MDNVDHGATLHTDEHRAYQGMDEYNHQPVNHSVGNFVVMLAHIDGIESFWSMLKRPHKGAYHKMSPKHFQRYIEDFTVCHSQREFNMIDRTINVTVGMIGEWLNWKNRIAGNGLSNGAQS